MAEAWTRHLAAECDLPLVAGSAGILDLGPVGSPTPALDVMRGAGIDLSGHRARALARVDMAAADLVIGFERKHVAAAVVDAGVPYERAFTLIELVRLLEASEPLGEQGPVAPESRVEGARRGHRRGLGRPSRRAGEGLRGHLEAHRRTEWAAAPGPVRLGLDARLDARKPPRVNPGGFQV